MIGAMCMNCKEMMIPHPMKKTMKGHCYCPKCFISFPLHKATHQMGASKMVFKRMGFFNNWHGEF